MMWKIEPALVWTCIYTNVDSREAIDPTIWISEELAFKHAQRCAEKLRDIDGGVIQTKSYGVVIFHVDRGITDTWKIESFPVRDCL